MLFIPIMLAAADTNDELVTVPKKYVSSEGLGHQETAKATEWAGVGREVGIATKEALGAVVDSAEKFGSTKVGTFVMIMVAWKLMAKEVLAVVIGVPMWFIGLFTWIWTAKRLFFGYKIVEKQEGKTKVYAQHPPYEFSSRDARAGAAFVLVVGVGVLFIVPVIVLTV